MRLLGLVLLTLSACGTTPAPDLSPVPVPVPVPVPDPPPAPPSASAPASAPAPAPAPVPGPAWTLAAPFPIEGFGASTQGGFQPGHDVYHVTSLADDGPGSLRAGLATGDAPRVVVFDQDGDIALQSSLVLPSNITIDGRGRHVTIRGKGFVVPGSDDVILVNLAIADVGPKSDDGVQIGHPTNGPSERVVLDHLSFVHANGDSTNVDEAISVIFGSRDVTIAWCRFERWEKIMLFGNGDADASVDSAIRVTVHHSYARETGRRHPQARYGVYDFYDNEWDDWRMYGWAWESPYRESFGAQAQDGARMIFESNIARRAVHTYDAFSQANDITRCESGGVIDERGTYVPADSTAPLAHGTGCPAVTTPLARPYAATIEPADAALRAKLESRTGNVLITP